VISLADANDQVVQEPNQCGVNSLTTDSWIYLNNSMVKIRDISHQAVQQVLGAIQKIPGSPFVQILPHQLPGYDLSG
jgi:hypothetical protein